MNHGNGTVRFGDFAANLATGELFRKGRRLQIQNIPFRILEVLLHSDGKLVGRDQLRGKVWPEVYVGQRSLNTAMRKLRIALNDSAPEARVIETVRGRGYRLLVSARSPSHTDPPPVLPAQARITILPFQNLGPAEDESFSIGLTDQMIAKLAHVSSALSIVAPVPPVQLHGATRQPNSAARVPSNAYIFAGSVLRADRRFRIIARLIRAHDYVCLWSETYTRNEDNVLQVQEEITAQIAGAIAQTLAI